MIIPPYSPPQRLDRAASPTFAGLTLTALVSVGVLWAGVGGALSAVPAQTANTVFAGPTTGIPGVPSFRAMVAADLTGITASGDLAGTYPSPTLATSISTAVAFSGLGATVISQQGAASALTLTGGTVTASAPLINATQTWNNSGVTFVGLDLNVVNTASANLSMLQQWRVGGTLKAGITRSGYLQTPGAFLQNADNSSNVTGFGFFSANSGWVGVYPNQGNAAFAILNTPLSFSFASNASINWASTTDPNPATAVRDLFLTRFAAAALQLGAAIGSGAAVAQTLQVQGSSGNSAAAALFTIAGSDQSGTTTTGGGVKIRGGNGTFAGGTVEIWTSATTTSAVAATFTAAKQTKLAGNLWLDNALVTGLTPAVSAGLLTKSIILYDNTGAAITVYGS